MADLDEVIDRLRELVEELKGVINDLWGLNVRCNSCKETPIWLVAS
jgi:hypothetical protein